MRKVIYNRFGGTEVLETSDVAEKPKVGQGQVRVQVHAAALNPKDALLRKGKFSLLQGRRFPKGTAHDFAGIVDAVGAGVTTPRVNEPVFGMQNGFNPCSAAEWVTVPADELAPKPEALSFQEAASLPLAGLTALQALRNRGGVQGGQTVVIRGASGGVGSLAVQIARALGAQVTAICSSANIQMVRDLGAQTALAYDRSDPIQELESVDVFFDVFGNLGFSKIKAKLSNQGIYVGTLPNLGVAADVLRTLWSRKRARLVLVHSNRADLEQLAQWTERGDLRPVIDSVRPLHQAAEAHQRLETRRSRGKVVLQVRPERPSSSTGGGTGS